MNVCCKWLFGPAERTCEFKARKAVVYLFKFQVLDHSWFAAIIQAHTKNFALRLSQSYRIQQPLQESHAPPVQLTPACFGYSPLSHEIYATPSKQRLFELNYDQNPAWGTISNNAAMQMAFSHESRRLLVSIFQKEACFLLKHFPWKVGDASNRTPRTGQTSAHTLTHDRFLGTLQAVWAPWLGMMKRKMTGVSKETLELHENWTNTLRISLFCRIPHAFCVRPVMLAHAIKQLR